MSDFTSRAIFKYTLARYEKIEIALLLLIFSYIYRDVLTKQLKLLQTQLTAHNKVVVEFL